MAQKFWKPLSADVGFAPSNAVITAPWAAVISILVKEKDQAGTPLSPVLELASSTATSRRLFAFQSLDGFDTSNLTDVEIYISAVYQGSNSTQGLMARTRGDDTNSTGYRYTIDRLNQSHGFLKYVSGTLTTIFDTARSLAFARHNAVFRLEGSTLYGKHWVHGDPVPETWQIQQTDTAIPEAGAIGLLRVVSSGSFEQMDVYEIGVGTNGDSAPLTEGGGATSINVSADPLTATALLSGDVQAGSGIVVNAQPLSAVTTLSASPVISVNQSADPLTATASLSGAIQTGVSLSFLWDFDASNLNPNSTTIDNATTNEPTVNAVFRGQTTWKQFYFKIENAQNKRPTIRVDTSNKMGVYWTTPWYSYDGVDWVRWDSSWSSDGGFRVGQLASAFTGDNVWIALHPAYPLGRGRALIQWLEDNHPQYLHRLPSVGDDPDWAGAMVNSQTDDIGRVIPAQPLRGFGVWDPTAYPADDLPKRTVVLFSGIHAGEHLGGWGMEGLVKFLVSGNATANELIRNFQFLIYPGVNSMGLYGGHRRGQWDPVNLDADTNRDWVDQLLDSTQKLVAMLNKDLVGRKVVYFIDFHSFNTGSGSYSQPVYVYSHVWADQPHRDAFAAKFTSYASYTIEDSTLDTNTCKHFNTVFETEHSYTSEHIESYVVTTMPGYQLPGEHLARTLQDLHIEFNSQVAFRGKYASLDFGGISSAVCDCSAFDASPGREIATPVKVEQGIGIDGSGKWRADMNALSTAGTKFVVISDAKYTASQQDKAFASNVTIQET